LSKLYCIVFYENLLKNALLGQKMVQMAKLWLAPVPM